MRRMLTALAGWVVRHRSRLPRWADRMLDAPAREPDGLIGRIVLRVLGGGGADNTAVPDGSPRVYIAPTNYSGQGYRWARALEASGVAARNLEIEIPGGFAFPADTRVPLAVNGSSREWQDAEWDAVRRFTHVLIEAERPIFGTRFGRDVAAETAALTDAGVSVAFLCHGTDIRDPRRHAQRTPWSPYPEDPRTEVLQADADRNRALLERADRPVFVSTPDLLLDVPDALWCPVVVDPTRFAADVPAFSGDTVRIMHSSSSAVQKGSDRIEPALADLLLRDDVTYRLVMGVDSARMPAELAAHDIVLDQFRLGSYGVAACEAMAAGRLVVGHVLPEVRAHVERAAGMALPIVEATPDTLAEVIAAIVADPQEWAAHAQTGPEYVRRVHDGTFSARVLRTSWIDSGR